MVAMENPARIRSSTFGTVRRSFLQTQVTAENNGNAFLNVPGSTERILITGQWVADCRAVKGRNYIEENAYRVQDILETGVVAQNLCGKSQGQSTPGTLLFYVRPFHWWEKMVGD
jgi:hypothetical protein